MIRRCTRDANAAEIVQALRAHGATIVDLSDVGKGVCDILVGHHGENYLIEIKTAKGKLDEKQKLWHDTWQGYCCVVRSVEDALEEIGYDTIE